MLTTWPPPRPKLNWLTYCEDICFLSDDPCMARWLQNLFMKRRKQLLRGRWVWPMKRDKKFLPTIWIEMANYDSRQFFQLRSKGQRDLIEISLIVLTHSKGRPKERVIFEVQNSNLGLGVTKSEKRRHSVTASQSSWRKSWNLATTSISVNLIFS